MIVQLLLHNYDFSNNRTDILNSLVTLVKSAGSSSTKIWKVIPDLIFLFFERSVLSIKLSICCLVMPWQLSCSNEKPVALLCWPIFLPYMQLLFILCCQWRRENAVLVFSFPITCLCCKSKRFEDFARKECQAQQFLFSLSLLFFFISHDKENIAWAQSFSLHVSFMWHKIIIIVSFQSWHHFPSCCFLFLRTITQTHPLHFHEWWVLFLMCICLTDH